MTLRILIDLSLVLISLVILRGLLGSLLLIRKTPEPKPSSEVEGKVSVIIPARNEEGSIGRCLSSLLGNLRPGDEVIVVDDSSEDGTFERALEVCDGRCRLVKLLSKPANWMGKSWACHWGYLYSSGDYLVFLDADTTVLGRVEGVLGLLEEYDAVSQIPRIRCEGVICGAVEVAFTSLLRLTHPYWRLDDPERVWLSGALMAWRRDSYKRIGGHASVRDSPVEDVDLARRAVRMGMRISFFRGGVAISSWTEGLGEAWKVMRRIMLALRLPLWKAIVSSMALAYVSVMVPLAPILGFLGAADLPVSILFTALAMTYGCVSFKIEVEGPIVSLLLAPAGLFLISMALFASSMWKEAEWKGRRIYLTPHPQEP